MDKYHENGELAPRDVVSRAIQNEMYLTGFPCVYLDITHKTKDYINRKVFLLFMKLPRNMDWTSVLI